MAKAQARDTGRKAVEGAVMPRAAISRKRKINPSTLALLLVAVLLASLATTLTAPARRGFAAETPGGSDLPRDPLGRLPSTPQEAQARLRGRGFVWPGVKSGEGEGGNGGAGGDVTARADEGTSGTSSEGAFHATSVQAGIFVSLPSETVEGKITHAGGGVRVERIRGSDTQTIDTTANAQGWFSADFTSLGQDIQSGDTVRVTDLTDSQSADVDCTLTATVNVSAETVSGNAASGNQVDVYLKIPSTYYGDIPPGAAHRRVTASGGAYNATFTGTNVRDGDAAYVFSTDASGHMVMEVARTAGTLVVYPQYDEVMGFYQPGVSVTVEVNSDKRTVGTSATGFFEALFTTHDIAPLDVVSANLGGARSITVADISATADPFTTICRDSIPSRASRCSTWPGTTTPETAWSTSSRPTAGSCPRGTLARALTSGC